MSAIVRTPECFPENDRSLNSFGRAFGWSLPLVVDPPVANHEACPGGFNLPGVLGGWTCPCECHRRERAS